MSVGIKIPQDLNGPFSSASSAQVLKLGCYTDSLWSLEDSFVKILLSHLKERVIIIPFCYWNSSSH